MLLGEGCTTWWQYPVLQTFLFPVLPSVSTLSGSLLLLSLLCRDLWSPLVLHGATFWLPHQSAGCGHVHRTKSSTRTTIFLETASTSSCVQEIECGLKMTHCFPLLASLYNHTHKSHPLLSVSLCSLGLSVPSVLFVKLQENDFKYKHSLHKTDQYHNFFEIAL